MKKWWWIIRAWYWLNYYTSWHWDHLSFAKDMYGDLAVAFDPKTAVLFDMETWYE